MWHHLGHFTLWMRGNVKILTELLSVRDDHTQNKNCSPTDCNIGRHSWRTWELVIHGSPIYKVAWILFQMRMQPSHSLITKTLPSISINDSFMQSYNNQITWNIHTNLITRYSTSCRLRSSSEIFLSHLPISMTKFYGDRSFTIAAPEVWNSLPTNVRSLTNLNHFKKYLKTYFFNCLNWSPLLFFWILFFSVFPVLDFICFLLMYFVIFCFV